MSKPLGAGKRKHHPIIGRDDDHRMIVVRDQTRRRELLNNEGGQQPPPIIDTKRPANQLRNNDITEVQDVAKNFRPSRTLSTEDAKPRKTWRNH